MQNIFSNSSVKGHRILEVEVLLATYNGALYIREFLDSLSSQEGVEIHLLVSDDGSTDETLQIIHSYESQFKTLKVLEGPAKGPSANFFFLISRATREFVALADQDDVWLSHHLISSILRLQKTGDLPSLTFSALNEFEVNIDFENQWPKRFPNQDMRSILTENLARGCTMVLNSKSTNLINKFQPSKAIMHDWWILLLIHSSGKVTWSTIPEVRYRIHNSNIVGRTPRFNKRLKRLISGLHSGEWKVVNQAEELLNHYSQSMSGHSRIEVGEFLNVTKLTLLKGRWKLIFYKGRYRTSIRDEVILRSLFLIRRFID